MARVKYAIEHKAPLTGAWKLWSTQRKTGERVTITFKHKKDALNATLGAAFPTRVIRYGSL